MRHLSTGNSSSGLIILTPFFGDKTAEKSLKWQCIRFFVSVPCKHILLVTLTTLVD
jgi:hypothetical protein